MYAKAMSRAKPDDAKGLLAGAFENGKIAEHWDVMETIADKSTWQNQNGKF